MVIVYVIIVTNTTHFFQFTYKIRVIITYIIVITMFFPQNIVALTTQVASPIMTISLHNYGHKSLFSPYLFLSKRCFFLSIDPLKKGNVPEERASFYE